MRAAANNLVLPVRTTRTVSASIAEVGLRVSALLLFVLMFVPSVNPARISEKINRNLSLFTSGFFYDSLVADMGRILSKGWIAPATMELLFAACFAACLGIVATVLGAAFSVGNNKLKRASYLIAAGGGLATGAGLLGVLSAYTQVMASTELDKVLPLEPNLTVLMALSLSAVVFSFAALFLAAAPQKGEKAQIELPMQLFLMLLPFLILAFVFSYLPLWGWRYSFYEYLAGGTLTSDNFVGFRWFTYLFESEATRSDLYRVVQNTLAMSFLGILTSWVPIAFAVFLMEIRSTRLRRFVQTLTTIPNFISWVLVYAVAFCIFSTDGFISSVFVNGGLWDQGQNMLMGDDQIWLKMLAWGMWKSLGWSAILYIAAITAIDPQLYEAAKVDGAGRFQRMWRITVPELIPTYMVLLLLSIASILNNGFEQYLVFENATNTSPITVLDLYVYKLGITQGIIPLSTVVGMVKSIISVLLLFGANAISKIIRGSSVV